MSTKRIESIDLLRGAIMIVMALDHVRDYFHDQASVFDPTDLSRTTVFLFFTRWITHFCAPVFMLLSGVSAYLVGERKGKKYLAKFLLTRGLWLIFLEFTVVNFAWYFNIHFPSLDFLVIWALGLSMVILSAIIYLPIPVIIVGGLIVVFGHNLLDGIQVPGNNAGAFIWALIHQQQFFTFGGKSILVAYPIVPWFAVMALGYALGKLYSKEAYNARRKKLLLQMGIGSILLFVVIRFTNVYGDPSLWSAQSSPMFTFLSFIRVSKYPPSLLYLLVTLGPALIFLALSENIKGWFSSQFKMIGRVAMFYYLAHLYLLHLMAMAATYFCGYKWSDMILDKFISFEPKLNGYGFNLGIVYLAWFILIFMLYFLCRWYDKYKTTHRQYWWLSYL